MEVKSDSVRIPRQAREALARHEDVTVVNRHRPAFVIVNPDDYERRANPSRRGRPLREAISILAIGPSPDPDFGRDLEEIMKAAGEAPTDPWAR